MRKSPPTVEGRSKTDVAVVALVSLVSVGFLLWFGYELAVGLSTPTDDLDGPALFHAYGCSTCHPMQGSGRGPQLTAYPKRAERAAKERSQISGKAYTAEDYTAESLVDPDAYIVDKFSAGVMRRPAGMSGIQLTRLIAFLLRTSDKDGAVRAAVLRFMPETKLPDEDSEPGWPKTRGDGQRGQALFSSPKISCNRCHSVIKGQGADKSGPNLHDIGVNKASYIHESIVDPNKVIAPSHRALMLFNGNRTLEGSIVIEKWPGADVGVLRIQTQLDDKRLNFRRLHLTDETPLASDHKEDKKDILSWHKSEKGRLPEQVIDQVLNDETDLVYGVQISSVSLMPNFKGILKHSDVDDLVVYLLSLKPKSKK
jgi:cytochrome c2